MRLAACLILELIDGVVVRVGGAGSLSLIQSWFREATPSARRLKGEFREVKWLTSLIDFPVRTCYVQSSEI